jgi:hypothetical protein
LEWIGQVGKTMLTVNCEEDGQGFNVLITSL